MRQDMQVLDDGTPPEVEEVLALAGIASAIALPMADVRQIVFDGHALAQLGPAGRGQLTLTQFLEQTLIGMDRDAASACAVSADRRDQYAIHTSRPAAAPDPP